jgi:hypothetical protein
MKTVRRKLYVYDRVRVFRGVTSEKKGRMNCREVGGRLSINQYLDCSTETNGRGEKMD